ncbi:hypothetical protein CH252_06250 [Rhodococcus sp. 06-1477-1B]|nr:hypothetical protein CH252_06250 [Rhodococcus sp. 06-1477-1B]
MSPFVRAVTLGGVALVAIGTLTACVPEAAPGDRPSSSAAGASSAPAGSATPSASPSPTGTALPASCDDIYSAGMRATLTADVPPLNDPGVTLLSTDQAPLLELLDVVPTLRCSWGEPGDKGLSTNVSVVTAAQADTVRGTLSSSGFGCETDGDATVCRLEQRGVSLDDKPYERGETQAVSGGYWITTSWVNIDPDGYTKDILAVLSR